MALGYKVYLDNTLLTDTPDGLSNLDLTIIRDGGVTSDDQVLRLKTEAEFTFYGDGYAYLCARKQDNYCGSVDVRIIMECDDYQRLAFIGLLPLVGTTTDPTRKTIKARIRDNSFSGYIRERQGNKAYLDAAKSATGVTIAPCVSRTIDFFNVAGTYSFTDRVVYDVFEVFKYLVRYLSNDTVTVVSDAFSLGGAWYKKYAITTGGMLYYGSPAAENTNIIGMAVPEVSFAEVFREVRKKLRIYMQVTTDVNGNATLRIEPESYFFSNVEIMAIDGIPNDLIETYDLEQIYSEVRIGSKEIDVDDGTFYTYPRLFLDSWQEESFNNCSDCAEESVLDLVSDWIIDSNVIHYTIDGQTPTRAEEVEHYKTVFLIETESATDEAKDYVRAGDYYYNDSLTNMNVFTNWARGVPVCVEKFIRNQCITGCSVPLTITVPITISQTAVNGITPVEDATCNSQQYIDMDFRWFAPPDARVRNMGLGSAGTNRAYYTVPVTGNYTFTISGDWSVTGSWTSIQLYLGIAIFNSTTVLQSGADESANLLGEYLLESDTITVSGQTGNMTLSTGSISIPAGSVVVPFRFHDYTLFNGNFQFPNGICFELNSYDISDQLSFVSDDILRKPLKWEFTYPICDSDFTAIQADPRGYMTVDNKRGWIKQIDYKPQKVSTITLQATETLCC